MRNILSLALIIFVSGCASMMKDFNQRTWVKVEHDRQYASIGSTEFSFKDSGVEITYTPDIIDAGIAINIKNVAKKDITIIWDESSYIDHTGKSEKVFHDGTKIIERANYQPATVIAPGTFISDQLIPVGKVVWDEGYSTTPSKWKYSPLCGERNPYTGTLDDSMCVGKNFTFTLAYQINGEKKRAKLEYKYVAKTPKQKKERKS